MKKYKFDNNKLNVSSNYTDLIPKNKKIAMLQIIINAVLLILEKINIFYYLIF